MAEFPTDWNESGNTTANFYKRKLVGDVQPDDDFIQLVGIAKNPNASQEFTLEDGTGKINVRNVPEQMNKIQENHIYHILGRYSIDAIGTHFLNAAIVQDYDKLNLEIYKKAVELTKKIV
jgi:hypothetical protein